MIKEMPKKSKKKKSVVNYGKIARDIRVEQTGLDSRFTTKSVTMKKHKKEKYKNNWKNEINF